MYKGCAASKLCRVKGSVTIEATVVLPMILFVVVFLIYSCFYLHDDMVIQEATHEIAIYGTTLDYRDTKKMKALMKEKYENAINGRLLATKDVTYDMKFDEDKIKVTIKGIMKNVAVGIFPGYEGTKISATKEAKFTNPVKTIKWMSLYWELQKEKSEDDKN